jgi:Flp pilus assembly protein TadB
LQEVNEKVKDAKKKNEELTAEEESQKNIVTKLEISRQEVTSENDMLKNKILCVQQAIYEAGKRKQVRNVYFLLCSEVLLNFFFLLLFHPHRSGFGGLAVSMQAPDTQDRGFAPG